MTKETLLAENIEDPQALETGTLVQYEFAGTPLILETHREVWSPTRFTLGMCEMMSRQDFTGRTVVDLASGSGILGILAALRGASNVIFLDINPTAIQMSERNWEHNGLAQGKMYAIKSDCFSAFQSFPRLPLADVIISNPPTAPSLEGVVAQASPRLATEWNSIENGDGRRVTDAAIVDGHRFLKPGGDFLIVTTRKQGTLTTMRMMNQTYGPGVILDPNSNDPLSYSDTTTGEYNWKVERTEDIPLDSWYIPYLDLYRDLNTRRRDLPPVITGENGDLFQRLYFIRARKSIEP